MTAVLASVASIDVPNSHWLVDEQRALKLPLELQQVKLMVDDIPVTGPNLFKRIFLIVSQEVTPMMESLSSKMTGISILNCCGPKSCRTFWPMVGEVVTNPLVFWYSGQALINSTPFGSGAHKAGDFWPFWLWLHYLGTNPTFIFCKQEVSTKLKEQMCF